jgi:hypothetical protein
MVTLFAVLLVPPFALSVFGADAKKGGGAPPDMDAMMKQWEKMATPGPEHVELAKSVGKWNVTTTFRMGPEAEPMTSKGSAEFVSLLGGRWIRQDFSGEFMGRPFHGVGHEGYDKFKKQYVSTWTDDLSTAFLVSYGTPSKDGKSIVFFGLMDEPMTGEKNKKVRSVTRRVDADTMVYESYDKAKGKEWKAMEITYTRMK